MSHSRFRRLPPVYSRIRGAAWLRAVMETAGRAPLGLHAAVDALRARYPQHDVLLTDSGTSALSMALEAAVANRSHRVVALPAYGCPDLGSAALAAHCRVLLYDIDPDTLLPDEASLLAAVRSGASAVVVVHFFGRLTDVTAVQELVQSYGTVVVEDAAQHAGGTLRGQRGGSFADLSVLSFGRGKGLNAGGGGALLRRRDATSSATVLGTVTDRRLSLRVLAASLVAEYLAHPRVFWLPAGVPALRIGETIYHDPAPCGFISTASASLLVEALNAEPDLLQRRRQNEMWFAEALAEVPGVILAAPLPAMQSGALRTPVNLDPKHAAPLAPLGVVRSYPRVLRAYPQIAAATDNVTASLPGAEALAARLHTLPTHEFVTPEDRVHIVAALRAMRAAT